MQTHSTGTSMDVWDRNEYVALPHPLHLSNHTHLVYETQIEYSKPFAPTHLYLETVILMSEGMQMLCQ